MKTTINPKSSNKLSFEKKILFFFFLVLSIIAVIVFLFIKISGESKHTRSWVTHTEKVLTLSDSMLANERDIIIGTRTYIITANENYLKSYPQSNASFKKNLGQLSQLTKDDPKQQKRIDSLEKLYQEYKAIRERTLALRKRNDFRLADQVPLTEEADKALAGLNSIFSSLQAEEKKLLDERRRTYQENVQLTSLVIRILLLIFIISIVLGFVIVYRNAVKRNKAELALRKSQELIRGIINYAPILVNVKDTSGKYILVNQQFSVALNSNPEIMIGNTNHHFLTTENADFISKEDQEVIKIEQPSEIEVNLPGPDGLHTYITSKFPLFDDNGKLYAVGSTSVDITPLKIAHEALEKSYQQQQKILNGLQQTLSASSDLLSIINEKGEFVMLSNTSAQLFGYTAKELMSKRYMDFVVEEDKAKTELIAQQIMAGQAVSEFTNHYKRKDGSVIPIIWSAKWLPEDKMMYCIARNGTEKIKTAYRLSQSQLRLSHAQRIAQLGNWDWDLKNDEWSCSDEIYNLIGIEKDETKSLQQLLLESIHPDDRLQVDKARDEALTLGKKIDIEHRIIRPDKKICYMHTKGEVILDEEGKPVWFSGTMQNITQRNHAELKLKELNADLEKRAAELKASNAELERFAYVASHDLQEPLRMVSSFLALLQKKHSKEFDETSKKYIHFAVDGAERMKGLIQDLLQYSKLDASNIKFTSFNLQEAVEQVLHILALSIKENEAVIHIGPLPVINGNKLQVTQLFQNLIGNALKYRSEKTPEIEIECKEENDQWLFSIRDNGIGIDPKYFDKIFVIFQRLHNKNEYSGTGIGLAICKKIIESHGGRIWVDSHPHQGSTFHFTLKKNNHA